LRHNGSDWVADSNLYNDGTNVGIGTTSPESKLDVYGTMILGQGGDFDGRSLRIRPNIDFDASDLSLLTNAKTGDIFVMPEYGESSAPYHIYYQSGADGDSSGIKILDVWETGFSGLGNIYYTSGNVGIGTTSPDARFHVNTTHSGIMALERTEQDYGNQFEFRISPNPIGTGSILDWRSLSLVAVDNTTEADFAETLSGDKTLTPGTDAMYQYLDEGGDNRVITLDTTNAKAGDRFIIRHNGAYDDTHYLQVKQGTTELDKIYAGAIKEFIFDGTNWISAETGTGEDDNKKYNVAIGYNAEGYDDGTAVGRSAFGYSSGVAVGSVADGYSSGAAVGYAASGYSSGAAVGFYADGYTRGAAVGYDASGYNYGAAVGYRARGMRYGAALGYYAGYSIDTGADRYNTLIGAYSGYRITTGQGNIILGYGSGYDSTYSPTTGSYNILIGYQSWTPANDTSNFLNIGGLIFGTNLATTPNTISSGNVGIGTTSPNAKLAISGGNIALNGGWLSGDGGNEGVYVDDAGLVGIGTTSPSEKLHIVEGRLQIDGVTGEAFARIISDRGIALLDTTQSPTHAYIQGITLGNAYNVTPEAGEIRSSDNADLILDAAGTGEIIFQSDNSVKAVMDTAGNVGIGTTTPGKQFHVYHSTDNVLAKFESGDSYGGIELADSNGSVFLYSSGDFMQLRADTGWGFYDTTDAEYKMKLYGTGGLALGDVYAATDPGADNAIIEGNVGIGTTSPGTKLVVVGLTATASYNYLRYDTATGNFYYESSSKRYKKNIKPLKEDFYKIFKARPKSFIDKVSNQRDIGYIAEELDKVGLKSLVIYNEKGQPDGVKYEKVPIYLLEVMRDWQRRLEKLEKENAILREKIKALELSMRKISRSH